MDLLSRITQWGGGVMMTAAFLIGILGSFSATREFVSWASPWGVQPIHFAFWLLGVGSIYTAITQGIRIRKLENTRPNILVEITETINDDWCLNVTNNGEEGNFEVQIALRAVRLNGEWCSTEEFSSWKGIWESTNTNDIKIMKDHHESVKLVHITTRGTRPILELLGYDFNAKSAVVIKAFDTTLPSLSDIIVRILVVISSHPSPKNGVFEKIYEITPVDMVEIKPSVFSKVVKLAKFTKR